MTQTTPAQIIEAVLFAAPEPMTPDQIRKCLPDGADLGAALSELQTLYTNRGVTLRDIDGRWAFRTADTAAPHLYAFRREEKKLSRAALETLAIIAYHQPVTRTEIENIRGVAVNKGTVDQLLELGWIKPGKRREIPGRPVTWLTTTVFMDHFGLSSLRDLPGVDELRASGLLDARPAIETLDLFAAEDAQLAEDAQEKEIMTDDDDLELLPSFATVSNHVANENADNQGEGEDEDDDEDEDEDDDTEDSFDDDNDEDDFDDESEEDK
jgi:segregation and condensation protein B